VFVLWKGERHSIQRESAQQPTPGETSRIVCGDPASCISACPTLDRVEQRRQTFSWNLSDVIEALILTSSILYEAFVAMEAHRLREG
jgi:hypothetical protein